MLGRRSKRMKRLLPLSLIVVLSAVALARQQPSRIAAPKPVPTRPQGGLAAPKPMSRLAPDEGGEAPKAAVAVPLPEVPEPPLHLVLHPANEADVKPLPLIAIPDDPPPHEGAMISIPITIKPPDILHVDVLQALPGRPIGGEHLVRGLTVTQAKEKVVLHLRKYLVDDLLGLYAVDEERKPRRDEAGEVIPIQPADSDTVVVDIQSYNSDVYYVQGDVGVPGRFPCCGHETVLDALNYAGGFAPTADETHIRLVRPARAGKPARVFPVDIAAIRDKGESDTNYQIFPGDRLVVGRNPVVTATVELDRLSNSSRIVINDILTWALMTKVLSTASGGAPMTAAQREAFLKGWLDTSVKRALEPGGAKMGEEALREMILRHLDDPAAAPEATPPPK